ncbi:SEC59/DGK1/VTE5 family protein [Rickettsiaceae bacterium]|nr:SEC59/DGK1/VTE5 family protein [Rickettsiaceae bacterium]
MDNTEILNFEIKRKAFHLCSIIFPIAYLFVSKFTMSSILLLLTCFTLYVDIYRHYDGNIKWVTNKFLGKFLRPEERRGKSSLTGCVYMGLGFLISCIFFSKGLAITSWLILIISDASASIIGIRYGLPLPNGKSYIGSIVFFVSAIFISIVTYFLIGYSTSFGIIIISSLLATIVEFFSKEINVNDNLLIPITYATSTFVLGLV